jgi:RHS repeat-associated protein
MRIYGQANANSPERTYANGFSYTADGKIQRLRLGNGRWESAKFNERLQVTELALGASDGNGSLWKLGYDYGELASNGTVDVSKNTGNIARQTISFTGLTNPLVQTYKYDSLYRLTEARETTNNNQTWKEAFNYDRYGNRIGHDKFVGTTQLTLDNKTHPTIDANTNRFNTGQGYVYDKNGNLTDDAEGRTFIFNGENKQRFVVQSGKNVGEYFYDGEGKRVKKKVYELDGVSVKEETVFVYSAGKLVAEYSTKQPPPNPTTSYTATDQLGSPRVITDSNGQVISRRDFMPFGEEIVNNIGERQAANLKYGVSDSVRQKFTGYQKDEETQLDFAEARMYENRHGRFTAVDPLLASGKSANPQSFNRYVYTMNNPILLTDPSGMCPPEDNEPCENDPVPEKVDTYWDSGNKSYGTFWGYLQSLGRDISNFASDLTTVNRSNAYYSGGEENFDQRTSQSPITRKYGGIINSNSAPTFNAMNDGMQKVEWAIERTPVAGSYYGYAKALGNGDKRGAVLAGALIPVDMLLTFGGGGPTKNVVKEGAETFLAKSGDDLVRVGRWMEEGEFAEMMKTGIVQESKTGTTHVSFPADPWSWLPKESRRVYAEFEVPASSLKMTNVNDGWAKILSPNSLEGRNAARYSRPIPQTPAASNIFCYICRTNVP